MSKREKIIDDLARMAGASMGILSGASAQAKSTIRTKIDDLAQDMDLVPRADFEKLELMLTKSREKQESLKARIKVLEDIVLGTDAKHGNQNEHAD